VILHPDSRASLKGAAKIGDTHMKKVTVLGLVLFCFAASINNAQAAPQCGPRQKIVDLLGQKFKEGRQGLGLISQLAMIELFVSTKGTWTMTSTNTQGMTCVIAAGESWQADPKIIAGLES
jgi:hypothetical protein